MKEAKLKIHPNDRYYASVASEDEEVEVEHRIHAVA